jgi:hypothetical protein
MVSMIVGRLHVSDTSREVIRAIRKALRKKARKGAKNRDARKALYREGLAVHAKNGETYIAVMSGRF